MPEAAKYFVDQLLGEKKDRKAIALFPRRAEVAKFNDLVSDLLVTDKTQFEILKAVDETINMY